MELGRIERSIANVRYISVIAVVALGFASFLMFVIGAGKIFHAYESYFGEGMLPRSNPSVSASLAIAYVVQAIDAFLIALVMLIFGAGIYNLFIHSTDIELPQIRNWARVESIYQLKGILAELVIIILMVKFLEGALRNFGAYQWEMLILPLGVLMLAAAVKLLQLKHS